MKKIETNFIYSKYKTSCAQCGDVIYPGQTIKFGKSKQPIHYKCKRRGSTPKGYIRKRGA